MCMYRHGFWSLTQQKASNIEAEAGIERADGTVKQGRAIMAFTTDHFLRRDSSHPIEDLGTDSNTYLWDSSLHSLG